MASFKLSAVAAQVIRTGVLHRKAHFALRSGLNPRCQALRAKYELDVNVTVVCGTSIC